MSLLNTINFSIMAKLIQIVGEDVAIAMYQGNVYHLTGNTKLWLP